MQPKFSIVLIARNEAKTLPRLLTSLKEFKERGGEVILLDTGSTDGTPSIARELGCKVEEVGDFFKIVLNQEQVAQINSKYITDASEGRIVNEGDSIFDYASARNYAAKLASNDVIAMPDCDEIYTALNIDEINKAIEEGVDQLEYNFVFSHDANGAELIKFLHSKFYNRTKMKWVGVIHEVLQGEGSRKFFEESVIKLEHFQNVETNRTHYLTGLAYDCFMNPENDRNAHYFGRELFYRGYPKAAIKQLEQHIKMNKWPVEAAQSMIFIGECYYMMGDWDKALASYAKAFDMDSTRREPLMKIAEHYYRFKKPQQVVSYVSAALQIPVGNFYANYQPYYGALPHEMLYWALWELNDVHKSKDHFEVCLAMDPFNPKYLHDFRFYFNLPKISFVIPTLGRPEGLKKCIDSIRNLNYPQDKIEIIVVHDGETPVEHDGISVRIFNTEREGVTKALKRGVAASTSDWIIYASNDIEFTPDSVINAFKTAMDNRKYFMAFNTGDVLPDEGNICEHFMIHRKLIAEIGGEVFDTEFNHVGVDNLLWAKMKKIGQNMRCKRAVVYHNHFSKTGEVDEVTRIAWNEENVRKDRALLDKKLLDLDGANSMKASQEQFIG